MEHIAFIPGDRALPRLPVAPHLRVTEGRAPAAPGFQCPLFSRIDGQSLVFTGMMAADEALAILVAGEA